MNEPDVTLSNLALVIECAGFAVALAWRPRSALRNAWIVVFAALALGSAFGGLVHGYFPDPSMAAYRVFWPLAVAFVIVAAAALAQVTLELAAPARRVPLQRIIWGTTAAFGLLMLLGNQTFALAISAYLPACLACAIVLGRRWLHERITSHALGVAGILLSIVAGGLQQVAYTPLPAAFGHNAFYHLLQLIALALVFTAAFRLTARPQGAPHDRPS